LTKSNPRSQSTPRLARKSSEGLANMKSSPALTIMANWLWLNELIEVIELIELIPKLIDWLNWMIRLDECDFNDLRYDYGFLEFNKMWLRQNLWIVIVGHTFIMISITKYYLPLTNTLYYYYHSIIIPAATFPLTYVSHSSIRSCIIVVWWTNVTWSWNICYSSWQNGLAPHTAHRSLRSIA